MYILSATKKLQEGATHLWISGHGVRDLGLGDTAGLLGVIFLSVTLFPKPVNTDHLSIEFSPLFFFFPVRWLMFGIWYRGFRGSI